MGNRQPLHQPQSRLKAVSHFGSVALFTLFLSLGAALSIDKIPSDLDGLRLVHRLFNQMGWGLGSGPASNLSSGESKAATREPQFTPAPLLPPEAYRLDTLSEYLPGSPEMSEAERVRGISPKDVLHDPLGRIGEDMKLPPALKERTEFWFSIYTRYGSAEHVIHHTRYPWIVYDVVDYQEEIRSGKGPLWLRQERGKKLVQKRRQEIRKALRRLAENPKPQRPSELQSRLIEALAPVKGSRRRVYREAAAAVRSQLGQKDFFISALRRSSRYLPAMEETFFSMGLPVDLTRMPFVESSFNELAVSKVGASGIWQIMPATGRAYGRVLEQIDERNSPLKATAMAARLLLQYRKALGSWPLAITAYNHGIGNIHQAIRAARSRDLATIISRYHQGDFRFASSNFYACFLAALYAERYSEIVFPAVARDSFLPVDRIHLTRSLPMATIQKITGLSREELIARNLDLRRANWRRLSLPTGFELHLPPGHASHLAEQLSGKIRIKSLSQPSLTMLDGKPIRRGS